MTLEEFNSLSRLHDQRIRMTFSDGHIVIATLHSVSTDLDNSRHVIYQDVEYTSMPLPGEGEVWYANGDDLISCVPCN